MRWLAGQHIVFKIRMIYLETSLGPVLSYFLYDFKYIDVLSNPTELRHLQKVIKCQLVWKLVNYQSISDNHETEKVKFRKNWQKLSLKIYLNDHQLTFTH